MSTRRKFLKNALGAGAGLALTGQRTLAAAQTPAASPLERNKDVARRYKETMNRRAPTEEFFAPGYKRTRAGLQHLANNARDQGFANPGTGLRDAIPDRVDVIGDRSEEHTSELQSLTNLVCRLLLEKKNECSVIAED